MACVEIDPQLVCVTMRMDATPLYCLRVGPILKYSTKFKKIAVKAE